MIPKSFRDSYTDKTSIPDIMLELDFQLRVAFRINEKITQRRHMLSVKAVRDNTHRLLKALEKIEHLRRLLAVYFPTYLTV